MLAGSLISKGIVNASDCQDAGLTGDGSANTCGMEKAYLQVIEWQNQFDPDIITAAIENEIPAQVIKRLFAQESQFWPQALLSPRAYGIGSVTSQGVEPLFMWYESVYQNTCIEYYAQPCALPYYSLPYTEQQELRGYFISRNIHAYCETCPYGIDLEKTRKSIDLFAKLIVANCSQVDLILDNHGFPPQEIPYEDLWRLTLANYTVGAGCVINGVTTMDLSSGFTWSSFVNTLDSGCYVDIYLNNITR